MTTTLKRGNEKVGGEQTLSKKSKSTEENEHGSASSSGGGGSGGCVLMWFRTDLRIQDNTALAQAEMLSKTHKLPLIAVYVVSPGEWKQHNVAPTRINFFRRNVHALQQALDQLSIPLCILHSDSLAQVPSVIVDAAAPHNLNAKFLLWNVEYEVNEGKRDAEVIRLLKSGSRKGDEAAFCFPQHDQCIVEPGLVRTKDGNKIYTVFTPFKRSWITHINQTLSKTLKLSPAPSKIVANANLPSSSSFISKHSSIPKVFPGEESLTPQLTTYIEKEFPAGDEAAKKRLQEFIEKRGRDYKANRDVPSLNDGTSKLSPYLSSGIISARQCIVAARSANQNKMDSGSDGLVTWISELCWRDFYKNILFGFPRVCMNKPFKLETDNIPWSYDKTAFSRWCLGKTGFPIVDAGMRQLNATGWMHNRLRMITAAFLVKDLLIDWRWGEKYFSELLIDGDFASNNGGWQWSASTGTDSQPYFRIFNPKAQAERFDPDAAFIKKWLPELSSLTAKQCHVPSSLSKQKLEHIGYVAPIVDHKVAADRCKQAFQSLYKKEKEKE